MNGDASCGDYPDEVDDQGVGRIICIQGERPGIVFSVSTHHDIPNDVGGSGRVPNPGRRIGGIVARSKVIEPILGFSSLFPYSQTDTAVLRRASGVYDFRPIAVPLGETYIERYAIGRRAGTSITLGSERKFPHSDNRVVGFLGNEHERARTELCSIPRLRRDNGAALVARRIVSALGIRFCDKDRSN